MQRRERLALALTLLILVGMPLAILGYQQWLRPALASTRVIDVLAAVPEAGGFQPGAIKVAAGETVTLRFSSPDVTHGIAIGPGLDIDLGHVDPGHVKEVTLTFDRAGTYTFYCNVWCSPNHWRMRGVVEVSDPQAANATPAPQRDPVIEALTAAGVNIDADHMAKLTFERRPSALRGASMIGRLTVPPELRDPLWRRSHTPMQGLDSLTSANPAVRQTDLMDAVAYLWVGGGDTSKARAYYDKNCTACHGQSGDGKGPASSLTVKTPAAFADPAYMFNMRSDVLYAKIRRGGMGTDMPNFGTVITPEETWALVDYLWTLTFGLKEPSSR